MNFRLSDLLTLKAALHFALQSKHGPFSKPDWEKAVEVADYLEQVIAHIDEGKED